MADTRQHDGKHDVKEGWWASHGVSTVARKLDFGDYMAEGSNVSVDTKRNVSELMGNLGRGFRRLDHECARAAEAGYRIVFLVEGGAAYADPSRLARVVSDYCRMCGYRRECNPVSKRSGCRRRGDGRKPFQGYMMMHKMAVLHDKYGAEFEFCERRDTARRVCELLGVEYDEQDADSRA